MFHLLTLDLLTRRAPERLLSRVYELHGCVFSTTLTWPTQASQGFFDRL